MVLPHSSCPFEVALLPHCLLADYTLWLLSPSLGCFDGSRKLHLELGLVYLNPLVSEPREGIFEEGWDVCFATFCDCCPLFGVRALTQGCYCLVMGGLVDVTDGGLCPALELRGDRQMPFEAVLLACGCCHAGDG